MTLTMKGKKRGILLVLLSLGLGGIGCGPKSHPPSEKFQQFLQSIPAQVEPQSQFGFKCDENMTLIDHIRDNHVLGDQLDIPERLKQSIQKNISKGKLPIPHYYKNMDHTRLITSTNQVATPKYLIHYIHFTLSPNRQKEVDDLLSHFNEMSSFCSTVSSIADVIQSSSNIWEVPSDVEVDMDSLLHKGIFRYFVEALDPHSSFYDWIEYTYINDDLSGYLTLKRDDEKYPYLSSQDPYKIDLSGSESVTRQWISGSSILSIEIKKFRNDTPDEFSQVYLSALREKPITGLVIDLRRNRGGAAYTVAQIADFFIKEGIVLFVRMRSAGNWYNEIFYAESGNELQGIENIPIVLLVSRNSASASEMLTSVLKDNFVSVVIGERTFGKGTGQWSDFIYRLPLAMIDESRLTFTSVYSYSPRGIPIQNDGINPDLELKDFDYVKSIPKEYVDQYEATHEDKMYTDHLPMPDAITTSYKENEGKKAQIQILTEHLRQFFSSRDNVFTLNDFANALP